MNETRPAFDHQGVFMMTSWETRETGYGVVYFRLGIEDPVMLVTSSGADEERPCRMIPLGRAEAEVVKRLFEAMVEIQRVPT